jgi:hypothetical protein
MFIAPAAILTRNDECLRATIDKASMNSSWIKPPQVLVVSKREPKDVRGVRADLASPWDFPLPAREVLPEW